jgi:hypothetical protein
MSPSQVIIPASAVIAACGIAGLIVMSSNAAAVTAIAILVVLIILQADITRAIVEGGAIMAYKLMDQSVQLREHIEELDEIIEEAAQQLRSKDEVAALNTLAAGIYTRERRQNG